MENIATTPGFTDAIPYLSGFLFVMLVLTVLWLVVTAIGFWFCSQKKKKTAALSATEKLVPTPAPPAGHPDQLPEEHLVAITAAVTLMLGSQYRLVSIRNASANWGREGRRQHLHSHSFR